MFDLYLITPERSAADIFALSSTALEVAPAGRVALQLRARHLPSAALRGLARALRGLTRQRDVRLLVSANLELAAAVSADGVQLPERGPSLAAARRALGPSALLGASRHDRAGLQAYNSPMACPGQTAA